MKPYAEQTEAEREAVKVTFYRKYPVAVIADFLHERYGDCMEDQTASELVDRHAQYGHEIPKIVE